jgi:hypothetical protein
MLRLAFFVLVLAPSAFAQAIIENALAASGGSAAGVAGKPVSDAASSIMGKAGALLDQAAGAKVKKDEPAPAIKFAPVVRYAVMPPAPPLPEVVPDKFRQVQIGLKREELLAQVGTPSSKIIMPEDNQMVEIYRYRANGASLGSIRLVDGKVTEVNQ